MSFIYLIRLLFKNLLWLLLIPLMMAASVYFFTRNEKKVYASESTIYTGIASGYTLSGSNKPDYYSTSNAFDNLLSLINSRETKQEVALGLLASHLLLQKFNPSLISLNAYNQLKTLVPDSIRQVVVKPTAAATILALQQYMVCGEGNLIYSIINSEHPFYSIHAMENIKADRINNSDLIKISYQTNDAITCRQTLELLEVSFMAKQQKLKEGQSESVVAYFELETHNAFTRLNEAEQRFMEFNENNDIINYYEQTKAVAGERENLYMLNHTLEMDKMASSKSLDKVNESIKGRLYQNEFGTAIIKEREQLADVSSKIAVGEIVGKNEAGHQQRMDSLRSISANLEKKLQGSVDNLYSQTNTPNGIPTKSVLDEWLKSTLEVEQSNARLGVMGKRKEEFQKEYRKYAPLGAILQKIERQINVSEREYLEMLHGLNTAKLTQQNNEITSKMNVVDPPYLPLRANPSKRLLLIVVGFMAGFILVLAFVLTGALINQTLQQPEKAARIVGIPLLGIYPLIRPDPAFMAMADLRLMQQLLSCINTNTSPVTIGLVSVQSKEGKTSLIDLFYQQLIKMDYTVEKQAWNKSMYGLESGSDIILIEFPPLDNMVIKPGLLPQLTHTFLVCRANRVWSKIDKSILSLFIKTTGNRPSLILNGVNAAFSEDYIGEMPRRRFFLRSFIKRMARLEFGSRRNIG